MHPTSQNQGAPTFASSNQRRIFRPGPLCSWLMYPGLCRGQNLLRYAEVARVEEVFDESAGGGLVLSSEDT
jgi:hypothetical protein